MGNGVELGLRNTTVTTRKLNNAAAHQTSVNNPFALGHHGTPSAEKSNIDSFELRSAFPQSQTQTLPTAKYYPKAALTADAFDTPEVEIKGNKAIVTYRLKDAPLEKDGKKQAFVKIEFNINNTLSAEAIQKNVVPQLTEHIVKQYNQAEPARAEKQNIRGVLYSQQRTAMQQISEQTVQLSQLVSEPSKLNINELVSAHNKNAQKAEELLKSQLKNPAEFAKAKPILQNIINGYTQYNTAAKNMGTADQTLDQSEIKMWESISKTMDESLKNSPYKLKNAGTHVLEY